MSEFIKLGLNTINKGIKSLKTIKKDKHDYRQYLHRIKMLPEDYQFVFKKMSEYMWGYSGGGDGYDMIDLQNGLLELFESSAAEGKNAIDVTGNDVAAFCDDLLKNAVTYTEKKRNKLNKQIVKKLNSNKL